VTSQPVTTQPVTTQSATSDLPLAAGRWTLDKNHSGVHFTVRHLGLSNVRGRFDAFEATLEVGTRLADVAITAEVDLASVNTNNADRDGHLRSTDFFGTDEHASMSFRSTSVTGSGDSYELTGDLTIAGVTEPVTFDVEFNGTDVFPADQSTHAGFTATGQIKRSDFGIDFGIVLGAEKLMLGDKIKIELDLQFVAP
jgi:polyisoprenoid-binding protein YceI